MVRAGEPLARSSARLFDFDESGRHWSAMKKLTTAAIAVSLVVAGMAYGMASAMYKLTPFPQILSLVRSGGGAEIRPAYRARVSHFATLPRTARVLMLGDSITDNAEWSEMVPGAVNRGISGDTTAGVLARLPIMPKSETAFLLIGLNDLLQGSTPEAAASNVAEILKGIQAKRVFLIPTMLTKDAFLNGKVRSLNALTASHCVGRCSIADLNPVLAPSGFLKPEFTEDGFHLNGAGYEVFRKAVLTQLAGAS